MSSRHSLLRRFTDQLAAFQASRDAFVVFAQVAANGTVTEPTPSTTSTSSSSSNPSPSPSPSSKPTSRQPETLIILDSSFNPPTRAHMRMATSAIRSASSSRGPTTRRRSSGRGSDSSGIRLLLLLAVNNADKAAKPAAFPLRMEMMRLFALDLLDEVGGRGDVEGSSATSGGGGAGLIVDMGLTTLPYFHEKSRVIAEADFYGGGVPGRDGTSTATSMSTPTSMSSVPEQVILAGYDTLVRIFNPKYYATEEGGLRGALDPFFDRARLRITMRTDDEWGGEEEQRAYLEGLRDGKLVEGGGRGEWCERVDLVEGKSEQGEDVGVSSTRVRQAAREGDERALEGLVSGRVKGFLLEERSIYAEA